MVDLSAGRVSMPARVAADVLERGGLLAAMPAFLPCAHALTTKLVSLFPGNEDRPTHQALICCFDPDNGTPLAVMDGTYVTAARTAAGSALATRLLARAGARTVAIIGTGVQARSHARAVSRLPGLDVITVAGRDRARADALARELADDGLAAVAAESIEAAVREADVVCAATHSDEPVVRYEWLRAGAHVNSVGYNTAGRGEVDLDTVRHAFVVVESAAAALAPPPAGAVELRGAIDARAIDADHIHELGAVLAGDVEGRRDGRQVTLYKSVGVAVQDAAAAALVLRLAVERGVGTDFPM
jgi:ornithine cyclodeaminase/alanine dehydrogenase-like protein (mu-crystallin family)